MKASIPARTFPLLLVLALLLSFSTPGISAGVTETEAALLKKAAGNAEKYRKGDAVIVFKSASGEPLRNAKVKIRQQGHEFLFGSIIFDLVFDGQPPYRPDLFKERFKTLFNFAVFPFYWADYEPRQGMTNWQRELPALEWCKANGITAKGHPLVWCNAAGVPEWLHRYPLAKRDELLKARVMNIVGGFAGDIDIWDVVNEPVNMRAWDDTVSQDYVQAPVEQVADYVDKAYRWAHEANPSAHLILNEFYTVAKEETRERFYSLVKILKERGTPLSGLGIQAHEPREEWFPPQKVWDDFDRLGSLGYPLHVTEFIPQSGGKQITGGWRSGSWTEQAQAEFAGQFYRLAFGHPAVVSINWWGLSDRDIWQPGGGLIDREYEPKPVYGKLDSLINREWKTSLDVSTGADGTVRFRGFYGDYSLELTTADNRVHRFDLPLRSNEENRRTFIVK